MLRNRILISAMFFFLISANSLIHAQNWPCWRGPDGDGAYYVPSPVFKDNFLFTTMTTGKINCIDIATGNILWVENMGPQYSSPVIAGGLVYMPKDDGVITIIKPGPKFEAVAKNSIGEKMFASPAISNGKIYLRGFQHLFCISSNGKF